VPDRLFSVLSDAGRWNFALEYDTGAETINPVRPTSKATVRRKLEVYDAAFRQERFKALWNFERLRILVITSSERRIANIAALQQQLGAAKGMFVYSTPERLRAHGFLGPAWTTADATVITLVPAPSQEISHDHSNAARPGLFPSLRTS
jgi:hypothetical protein